MLAGGTQKEESDATPLSSWCELLRFTGDRFSTSTGKAFRRRSGINSVRFLDNETFAWSRGGAPLSFDSAGYIELWKVDDDEIRNARTIWRGRNLYGLDYHPASQSLAWGDETGTVFVCDVTDTRQVAMAQGTHRPAVHVRFSPSGQELAVTSVDGEVTRWRVEITGVAKKGTDPEAPRVAATSAVNSANLKSNDAKSNQPKSDDLKTIDSKADEPAIVSNASKPKTTKTGVDPMPVSGPVRILLTHVKDCRGHDEAATATIFIRPDASKLDQTLGPRGYADHLISCGNDARVLLWSNQSHAQIDRTLLGRRQLVDAMWISPKQLAVTSYASIASKETLFRSALLSKHGLDVECRHVPGARSFASDAGPVQTIRSKTHPPRYLVPGRDAIWLCEYGNMMPIRRFSLPECLGQGVITAAAMVDSKYLVATVSERRSVAATEPRQLKMKEAIEQKSLKTETKNHMHLVLFSLESEDRPRVLPLHKIAYVENLSIADDGSVLVGGSRAGQIFTVQIGSGQGPEDEWESKSVEVWHAHSGGVRDLAWISRDQFVSVSDDGTCQFWNTMKNTMNSPSTGQRVADQTIYVSRGATTEVCVSSQGNRLATVGEDRVIRIWDLRSGLELISLQPRKNPVTSLSFSPDDRYLLVVERRSRIETIQLQDPPELAEDAAFNAIAASERSTSP